MKRLASQFGRGNLCASCETKQKRSTPKRLLGALSLAVIFVACSSAPDPASPRPAATDREPIREAPRARASRPSAPRSDVGSQSDSPRRWRVRRQVVASALDQLGRPYEFAGATPRGFDCSGLVDFVFAKSGVRVPRTSSQQAASGRWVAMDEVLPGDLVFFSADGAVIDHVGVVVSLPGDPLEMVHASTSRGVVKTQVTKSRYWMGRLRFARRVLD